MRDFKVPAKRFPFATLLFFTCPCKPIAGSATFFSEKAGSPQYPPILPNPSHELSYGILDTETVQIVEPKKGVRNLVPLNGPLLYSDLKEPTDFIL